MHTFRLKTPYRLVLSVSIPNVVLMIRPHVKCNKKEAKSRMPMPRPRRGSNKPGQPQRFALKISSMTTITNCVKLLRTLLTLLLVGLWPVATSHCSLEQIPGLEFLACADEPATPPTQKSGCATDSCAFFESGFYKTEDGRQAVPTPRLVSSALMNTSLLQATQAPAAAGLDTESSPPEISKAWQFSFRTALPPRAPSLAS